ncbi:hypothetical protein [uncultured Agrococcus sp.]|uniref:hypothetical protein n=1 Tax=uncultured Agrococcus sp. TaxID=382258 RepID=UPI0025F2B89B|nr:hypothetical protein [uncultured Agrococcus sp.]
MGLFTGRRERSRQERARVILAVDGVACGAGAVLVAGSGAVARSIGLGRNARAIGAIALAVTSIMLLRGAGREQQDDLDLRNAAAVNAAWVATCGHYAKWAPTRAGRRLAGTVALADAIAGVVQWRAQKR